MEPFVGGASMMALQSAIIRVGGDANTALINMWRALSNGWIPPNTITEEQYNILKLHQSETDPMTAFAGFGCSFAGKWFGGYARGGVNRNYASNAASSLRRKMTTLHGVQWYAGDYKTVPIPYQSVIYCDPPYKGTTQYGAVAPFEWGNFWKWCADKQKEGHMVFISEYEAPSDFHLVHETITKTDIRCKTGRETRIERLFCPSKSYLDVLR